MGEVSIAIEQNASSEIRERINGGLISFNAAHAQPASHGDVTVVARVGREVVGGLLGHTNWDWLFISRLWVGEGVRRQGIGACLVKAAEAEAVRRGCRHAHVDTFSFQARPFYERQGYVVFGVLEDYPAGHSRFFLQKRDLADGAAG